MNKYIDFHTHKKSNADISIQILSPSANSISIPNNYFTLGLHPWFIDKVDYKFIENKIKEIYNHKNFFALGEIGLDKNISIDFDKQIFIFEEQIKLAIELNIQTIILHSVKAYSEILTILKKLKWKNKVILHGFNSSIEMVNSFNQFNTFFSFGDLIFKNSKAKTSLSLIPLDRIFLETDDQQEYSIQDIYLQAAKILNINEELLCSSISENFKKNFTIAGNNEVS